MALEAQKSLISNEQAPAPKSPPPHRGEENFGEGSGILRSIGHWIPVLEKPTKDSSTENTQCNH